MEKEFRKELWVFTGIMCGTLLIGGGLLVWMNQRIVEETKKISENRFAFMQYSRTIDLLAELKRAAPVVKSYQEKMNLLLPKKDDLVEFPRWIDGLSRVNKVSHNFAFQGSMVAAQEKEPGSMGFTLDVSGANENVRNFFRELELRSNRFLTSVDSFDLAESVEAVRVLARGRIFFR